MAKTPTDIRSLARSHTEAAINALVGILHNSTSDPAKVSAANAILDRGWGKAPQPIENGENGAFELLHRIERVIVDPKNRDG